MNARLIAFYLPQYYPIEENDRWYGKGFTEWTNVSRAKPLFRGHYQPHIPADLGFYDLRLQEVQIAQIQMAKRYGLEGFCYWHYWFGNGKELLDMPFKSVLKDKTLNFPFCLAWANHSWEKKLWDSHSNNQIIVEQQYLGNDDYEMHFYSLLDAFNDERYIKVDGKILFIIYNPLESIEIENFISCWRHLAEKNGLKGIHFVGKDFESLNKEIILSKGFDAIYNDSVLSIHHHLTLIRKIILLLQRKVFKMPTTFPYREAIKYMVPKDSYSESTIPLVAPNWDHSPRSKNNGIILTDSNPIYFKNVLKDAIQSVNQKPNEKKIIIIKSWNEWGEGNHLEPDLKYGNGFLEAIKKALEEEK